MTRIVLRRIAIALPLLLLVSFAVFALTAVSPTDPARAILGDGATPAAVAGLRQQLGLNAPLLVRFWDWLVDLCHGSLGTSWFGNQPVTTKIVQGLPVTLALVLPSLLLSAAVALPLGLYTGLRAGGRADRTVRAAAGIGLAVPEFWVGLMLVLLLSEKLHLLPGTGTTTFGPDIVADVRGLVLPVIALSLPQICALLRMTRASAAEVAEHDFIRTARAAGESDRRLLWTHLAKNALVPSVALLGLQLGRMIGVAAVVESVFGMHGLGSTAVQAALSSDLPVVLGVVLVTATVVMAANLLADLGCYALAPRTRDT
jgi:peptide/nickel transport system permease protein